MHIGLFIVEFNANLYDLNSQHYFSFVFWQSISKQLFKKYNSRTNLRSEM